jgi:rhomboid protease GluP
MTAQVALMLRWKWQLGAQRMPVRTWLLLQPLVVNLLISVLPFIDLAAHLGGGFVGAGLVFSGLVWGPRPAAVWRPAAWAASLAMAGCLAVALAQGRPWELLWPPPLVLRAIPDTPITVPVPDGLSPRTYDKENVAFGNPVRDPLVLYCKPDRLDAPCPDPERRACLSKTARDFAAKPLDEGWPEDQPPRVVRLRTRPAVFYALRSPNGRRQMTWLMLEGTWWLRLDVVLEPDATASWAGLASTIAEGVTVPPAAL